MTMQTFVVLFLGIAFGYKIGLATVTVYLVEGIIGIPVFSNSPEKGVGLVYFTGPTMGYLIGFLPAVFLAGYLKLKDNIFLIFIKLTFDCFNNLYTWCFLAWKYNWLGKTNISIRVYYLFY